ncbi:MAG: hypothetical protein HN929_06045 [Chloroflexi bacterium]|jgi:hypothetical protein|nr:hypothetical protein [Chloroflexota bacterium]
MESPDAGKVMDCPQCKQHVLLYNSFYNLYECNNEACKASFSQRDWDNILTRKAESSDQDVPEKTVPKKQKKIKYKTIRTSEPVLQKILIFPFKAIWGLIKLIFWWMD